MVRNLPESRQIHKLPRKFEEISINIFLLRRRFAANGPLSDVIPIRAFPCLFRHEGEVFIIRHKLVIGTRFGRLFIERLLDQCLRRLRRLNVALIRRLLTSLGIGKHKTQIKTQNTKLKSLMRGRTGGGAIFKFDDVGPRPSGLKGCAIRRSRANAVQ